MKGFTLIEAMITVTIIGILAAIAIPQYQQYIYRANRTIAKTAIMKIASQQETFYNDRKAYATTLTAFNIGTTTIYYPADTSYLQRDGTFKATSSTSAIYAITLAAYGSATAVGNCTVSGSATTLQYAIKATPVNSQAKDSACMSLCYGSVGDRGTSALSGANASDCWRR